MAYRYDPYGRAPFSQRLLQAAVVLVLIALAARLVWELLRPLLPVLMLAAVLLSLGSWWRTRRQW